jgi:hypothetical protein
VKIIVNDANILIDLVDIKILPYFFQLKFEFHTTAIILDELFEEQKEALFPYIETGQLSVDNITEEDLMEILMIRATNPNLSEQDCSAFYQKLYFNTLTFEFPSENKTFYFSKDDIGKSHKIHKTLFPKEIDSIFPG